MQLILADRKQGLTKTHWPRAGLLLLLLAAAILSFWPTLASMVAIWNRSDTFAHGYLIPVISLYLIWHDQARWRATPLRTDYLALLPLALLGFGWLLAHVVDILVVQQLAVVAMVPMLVWLLCGRALLLRLAFPLGFLLFMVPFGEGLVFPMMQFTASFTVYALRLTGIPVYWEGTYFSLPSGDWSVVEACSGVRYLIASVVLGCVYAYLTYRSLWRRLVFIALATIVPVFANGLRAYLIVMLAHLSNMKLAVGIDHLIYGWVFFGIVMFVLFSIGALWREVEPTQSPEQQTPPAPTTHEPSAVNPIMASLLGCALLILWPLWANQLENRAAYDGTIRLTAPAATTTWTTSDRFTDWTPRYVDATFELTQAYRDGTQHVGLHIAYYREQTQGAELINSQNVFIEQKHPVWREPYRRSHKVRVGQHMLTIQEAELSSLNQNLLAWRWYWINGRFTSNALWAKWLEAQGVLLGQGRNAAGLIVYTPQTDSLAASRHRLQRFVDDRLVAIHHRLTEIEVAP